MKTAMIIMRLNVPTCEVKNQLAFHKVRWFLVIQYIPCFKNFAVLQIFFYIFLLKQRINGHIHNAVSRLLNVVKIFVENDNVVSTLSNVAQISEMYNVDSTLFNVVNFNVYLDNIVSTLIERCATSQCHINLKTTLKRR